MPRTIISLSETEKDWLTQQAKADMYPWPKSSAARCYSTAVKPSSLRHLRSMNCSKRRVVSGPKPQDSTIRPKFAANGNLMMAYWLDSVILIDHFNGVEAPTRYLKEHAQEIAISVITRAEVLTGFDTERESLAKAVLARIHHYPVTQDEADLAARLRRQLGWKLPDALQAAIALNHHLQLVTPNTKDFDPTQHACVVVPYLLDRPSS